MCTTCGCGDTELVPVELHEKILAGNDRTAAHNRAHFREAGVLALNLMGSPGSGKTAVLEATARLLPGVRLGAVSADLATDNDAVRLSRAGIPSRAITTGQACHLDAEMVHRSLHGFPWEALDVFFIENVGNLVCPAIYDLGQEANVVVLSVAEGEDKPLKYPVMFQKADLVLVTKADLVPHLDVEVARIKDNLARVMPDPRVLLVSARTGLGMAEWKAWLEALRGRAGKAKGPATLAAAHAHDHGDHGHDHDHGHPHDHGHDHPHDHDHGHAGEHAHGEGRGPDHAHDHTHEHQHPHVHEHSHEHAHGDERHAHPHQHRHAHGHQHRHAHGDGEAHDHGDDREHAGEPHAHGDLEHAHQGGGSHAHRHAAAPAAAKRAAPRAKAARKARARPAPGAPARRKAGARKRRR